MNVNHESVKYALYLWESGRKNFEGLFSDEKSHLAGLLIQEMPSQYISEIVCDADKYNEIPYLIASYMTECDIETAKDKRDFLIEKLTSNAYHFMRITIDELFQQIEQEEYHNDMQNRQYDNALVDLTHF